MKINWPGGLAGLALLLAVAALWLSHKSADESGCVVSGSSPAAVAVEVEAIRQGEIRDIRRFTGTLYPTAQFEVAARASGRLLSLEVDIGDVVERGQIIARLENDEFVQEVEQARAELDVARASLTEAASTLNARQREFERIKELRSQKIASEAELDAASGEASAQAARVRLAQAQVAQNEAALRAAEVRLSYSTIRADWQNSGDTRVVGERFVDEGTTIAANTAIVSVLDDNELNGVVFVTERDYPRLAIGQSVEVIADSYPQRRFAGEIIRIAPLFQEASRQARVEIRIPNPERILRSGMFVSVHVQLAEVADATLLPRQALVERDGERGVFLIEAADETVRFVPVTVGIIENQLVQIVAPALTGEVVVLGQHLLSDASRVLVVRAGDRTNPAAPQAGTLVP